MSREKKISDRRDRLYEKLTLRFFYHYARAREGCVSFVYPAWPDVGGAAANFNSSEPQIVALREIRVRAFPLIAAPARAARVVTPHALRESGNPHFRRSGDLQFLHHGEKALDQVGHNFASWALRTTTDQSVYPQ